MFRKWIGILMILGFIGCNIINPIGPIISIGIAWLEGEATKYYESDQDVIYEGVHYALKKLDFPIIKDSKSGDTFYITADTGDRFKIKVERIRHNITKLSIRVNIMGDKPYAELIYKRVEEYPGVKCFTTIERLKTKLREKR